MAGFGHYPFGHAPFGGALVPDPLSATLSTLPSTLTAGAPVVTPAALGLLLTTVGAEAAWGLGVSPAPVTATLTLPEVEATVFSQTIAPPEGHLVGTLSVGAVVLAIYEDTVSVTPLPISVLLGTVAPGVTPISTLIEPGALSLACSIPARLLPIDGTIMEPEPVVGVLSVLGSAQSMLANTIRPAAPLSLVLTSIGTDVVDPLTLTPVPVVLTLSLPRSFVFSGLPYTVDPVRVSELWTLEPGLTGPWELVVSIGEPWAVHERSL